MPFVNVLAFYAVGAVGVVLVALHVLACLARRFSAGQSRHSSKELLGVVVIGGAHLVAGGLDGAVLEDLDVNLSTCMALSSPEHGGLAVAGGVRAPLQLPTEFPRLALHDSL